MKKFATVLILGIGLGFVAIGLIALSVAPLKGLPMPGWLLMLASVSVTIGSSLLVIYRRVASPNESRELTRIGQLVYGISLLVLISLVAYGKASLPREELGTFISFCFIGFALIPYAFGWVLARFGFQIFLVGLAERLRFN